MNRYFYIVCLMLTTAHAQAETGSYAYDVDHIKQAMEDLQKESREASEALFKPPTASEVQGCLDGLEMLNLNVVFTGLYGEFSMDMVIAEAGDQWRQKVLDLACDKVQDAWGDAMDELNAGIGKLNDITGRAGITISNTPGQWNDGASITFTEQQLQPVLNIGTLEQDLELNPDLNLFDQAKGQISTGADLKVKKAEPISTHKLYISPLTDAQQLQLDRKLQREKANGNTIINATD